MTFGFSIFHLLCERLSFDRRGCGYSITIRSVLSVDVWMLCLSLCDERERSQSCAFEVETGFGFNCHLCVLSPMRRGEAISWISNVNIDEVQGARVIRY